MKKKALILIVYMQIIILHRSIAVKQNKREKRYFRFSLFQNNKPERRRTKIK